MPRPPQQRYSIDAAPKRLSTFAQVFGYPPEDDALSDSAWLLWLAMAWVADEGNGRFCYADPRTKVWPRALIRSKRTYDRGVSQLLAYGAIVAYKAPGRDLIFWVNSPSGYYEAFPKDRDRFVAPPVKELSRRGVSVTYLRVDDANDEALQNRAS